MKSNDLLRGMEGIPEDILLQSMPESMRNAEPFRMQTNLITGEAEDDAEVNRTEWKRPRRLPYYLVGGCAAACICGLAVLFHNAKPSTVPETPSSSTAVTTEIGVAVTEITGAKNTEIITSRDTNATYTTYTESENTNTTATSAVDSQTYNVKDLAGDWYVGEEYFLHIYNCDVLNGSYDYTYLEFIGETEHATEEDLKNRRSKECTGKILLEQGTDSTGMTHQYFNFYDQNGALFLRGDAEMILKTESLGDMNGDGLTDTGADWEMEWQRQFKQPDITQKKQMLYSEAFPADAQKIAGNWRLVYPTGKYPDGSDDLETVSELTVQADGSFTQYSVQDYERGGQIGKGTVSANGNEYIFRYDDGTTVRMVPKTEDPLNGLTFVKGDDVPSSSNTYLNWIFSHVKETGWFERNSSEYIPYDRQFKRVEKAPQGKDSKISVKACAGQWYSGESYRLKIDNCSDISGSYAFQYLEYIGEEEYATEEEIRNRKSLDINANLYLEQGVDNTGKLRYYYNFYDEKGELFMSVEAEPLQEENFTSFRCDYFWMCSCPGERWERIPDGFGYDWD
ncbi:MAG: hypothetical protein IK130_07765 [Oscillospiraceae bacterium]|nr:hypothetical protein [Oscillospiraceae bacterium]